MNQLISFSLSFLSPLLPPQNTLLNQRQAGLPLKLCFWHSQAEQAQCHPGAPRKGEMWQPHQRVRGMAGPGSARGGKAAWAAQGEIQLGLSSPYCKSYTCAVYRCYGQMNPHLSPAPSSPTAWPLLEAPGCPPPHLEQELGEGSPQTPLNSKGTMQTNVLQHAAMQIALEHSTFSPALIAAPPGLRSNSSVCVSDSSCPLMPLTPSAAGREGGENRAALGKLEGPGGSEGQGG